MIVNSVESSKIQLLKGIAIIAVVCAHSISSEIAQIYLRPFLNFSVGLFLFLSGLLSCSNNWHPWKRIKKVLIPYVVWTLIYTVLSAIRLSSFSSIPFAFIKHLINAKAAAPFYYIYIYCELTLLIPLIDKLAHSRYKYCVFFITPIEIIVMRTIPLITGYQMNSYISTIMSISCLGLFAYFYLGYLIGNNLLSIECCTYRIVLFWIISILLQILEGYWYYFMGQRNCGTQFKLSAILSGALLCVIAYRYITTKKNASIYLLKKIGDSSFGIFFSHIAVMQVMNLIPNYSNYIKFPVNALITLIVSLICVSIGKIIIGKYSFLLGL